MIVYAPLILDAFQLTIIVFFILCIAGGTIFSRSLLRRSMFHRYIDSNNRTVDTSARSKGSYQLKRTTFTATAGLPFVLFGAMLATQSFDANSVIGNISLVYQNGFWTGAIIPIGFATSLVLTGFLYGKKLNKMKLLTLPDFYYRRYGNSTQTIASIILIISFIVLITGDLVASGYILSTVFHLDFFWSVLIAAIIVLLYSFSGGIFSSAYADIIFVFLAIIGLWAAYLFITFFASGEIVGSISSSIPQYLDFSGLSELTKGPAIANWTGIMTLGLAGIISLGFTERIFAAKDAGTVRKGAFVGAGLTLLILVPVGMIGVSIVATDSSQSQPNDNINSNIFDEDIINSNENEEEAVQPFTAYPRFALDRVPFPIGIALLVAVLGASMSTASGGLSAISSVISRNIIQRGIMKAWLRKEAGLEDRQLLLITRVFVAPIIIIAFGLAYTSIAQPGINLILAFEIVFAGAWAPLILGLFWRKANKLAAIVSLIVGSLLKLVLSVLFIFILQPQDSVGVEEQFEIVRVLSLTVIPPLVSTILFIIISLTTQRGPSRHDVIDHVPALKDVIRGEDLEGYLYDQHKPARQQETVLEARKEERIPKQIKYIILIFYASILIGWLITRTMLGVDIPFYIVSSESMLPNLKVRDMVIIKNIDNPSDDSAFDNLKRGDIIVFKSDDKTPEGKQRTIVHRIIDIENNSTLTNGEESTRVIRTKGDNNPVSYNILDYPISKKDYIGKVVYVIPGAGA